MSNNRVHTFILSAPAGTGKTTLVNRLKAEFPNLKETVSTTTRLPRKNEVDGQDYHFISKEEFMQEVAAGRFLEWVQLYDEFYGTHVWEIDRLQSQGCHAIMVIDTQGALALRSKLKATYIFVSPPSVEELKKRLLARKTESAESLEKRLLWASQEMPLFVHYDYHIINDDLEKAYQQLKSIYIAEQCRVQEPT